MAPDERLEDGQGAQHVEASPSGQPAEEPIVAVSEDVATVVGGAAHDATIVSADAPAEQPAEVAAAVAAAPVMAAPSPVDPPVMAAASPGDAVPADTADAQAIAADAPAIAADAPAIAADAPADAAAAGQPATQRRRVPRPIRAVGRGIAAVAPTVIGIGLLTVGLVGGWQIATTRQANQLANQAPITPVAALAPAQNPPVVVSEVISAIGADDGNLLAASLPEGPLTQIKNALTGVSHVRRVVPAGTVSAGDQTVTAVQIIAEDASGQLFGIDLLIHTDSTGVVGFR